MIVFHNKDSMRRIGPGLPERAGGLARGQYWFVFHMATP
jgi:hypothetical protein